MDASVSLGYHNKILRTGPLNNRHLFARGSGGANPRARRNLIPSEGSLPRLQTVTFSPCPHMAESSLVFLSIILQEQDSTFIASLALNDLLALSPNTEVGLQHEAQLRGDAIQSIATSLIQVS